MRTANESQMIESFFEHDEFLEMSELNPSSYIYF